MKSFLKRIFVGFMISLLGFCNILFLGFIIFIFTTIHTIDTAWGAIACFACALFLLMSSILFIYLTGLIPQEISNKCKVEGVKNEE